MTKLKKFITAVLSWGLGFIIAGYIFCAVIFYVLPYATGLPVNTDKYMLNASQRISDMQTRVEEPPAGPSIGETVLQGLNDVVDYLLQFVIDKEEQPPV